MNTRGHGGWIHCLAKGLINSITMRRSCIFVAFLWILATGSSAWAQTLAFPGAEGFGRFAKGGRGGVVLHVTNLNKSGPGSFRDALFDERPRTIVFDVSGIIELESDRLYSPYLTIAGETAPGDGILIRGGFSLRNHDVIIRHLAVRPGFTFPDGSKTGQTAIAIWGEAHDAIVDHCSFTWARDDIIGFLAPRITVQRSIMANGLQGFDSNEGIPKAGIVHTEEGSFLHNLFANVSKRGPAIGKGDVQFINNLIYNTNHDTRVYPDKGPIRVNIINNYFARNSGISTWNYPSVVNDFEADNTRIYIDGNYHVGDSSVKHSGPGSPYRIVNEKITGFPAISSQLDVLQVQDDIINNVGPMVPIRSPIDQAIIDDVKNDTSNSWDPNAVSYPNIPFTQRPANFDADRDGMEDAWEVKIFGSTTPDNNGDHDTDGYTNLEEYLHYLSGNLGGANVTFMATPNPVERGDSVTLQWEDPEGRSCVASGDWSGVKASSGSLTIPNVTENKTFLLTCGDVEREINLAVINAVPKITNFTAEPEGGLAGGSTTLEWATEKVTSCTASGDWSGSKALSGSESFFNITTDQTYTLSCDGPHGPVSKSMTVNVFDPEEGMMARWKFDGNANDVSGEGNHGILKNNPTFIAGKFNQAIQFDGVDDHVEVLSGEGKSTFSISLWIKTQENGGSEVFWKNPTIIGKGNTSVNSGDFGISSKNGNISLWSGITTGDADGVHMNGSTKINDNQWHHIVLTSDGSTMTMYVDNVQETTLGVGRALNSENLWIGGLGGSESPGHNHSGIIDDVRFYDKALNADEIAKLFDQSASGGGNPSTPKSPTGFRIR